MKYVNNFESRHIAIVATSLMLMACLATDAFAQPGQGRGFRGGRGPGGGGAGGQGRGHGHDERHDEDHEVFRFLLTNHEKITRTVKNLPNGVETVTESDDSNIVAKIQEHVYWMNVRIDKTQPIRMRDPLFAELFRHTDKITMKHEDTDNGVRVIETSDDPYVVKLIQEHAQVVSGFVKNGFDEAMKNHAVPGKSASTPSSWSYPAIAKYGGVVKLSEVTQQPRDGAKIVVDLTKGGDPGKLLGSVEKVARFVNIYAGAGRESAKVKIAVVLHGDATLSVLNADAYSKRFDTDGNPNLDCLHELHEAGVELFVCGQSLTHKKADLKDVVVFADVAVSALTSLANLQADGYAYVPLK